VTVVVDSLAGLCELLTLAAVLEPPVVRVLRFLRATATTAHLDPHRGRVLPLAEALI
jgi:hypothetical protein